MNLLYIIFAHNFNFVILQDSEELKNMNTRSTSRKKKYVKFLMFPHFCQTRVTQKVGPKNLAAHRETKWS